MDIKKFNYNISQFSSKRDFLLLITKKIVIKQNINKIFLSYKKNRVEIFLINSKFFNSRAVALILCNEKQSLVFINLRGKMEAKL
jgi:hypothetical protein